MLFEFALLLACPAPAPEDPAGGLPAAVSESRPARFLEIPWLEENRDGLEPGNDKPIEFDKDEIDKATRTSGPLSCWLKGLSLRLDSVKNRDSGGASFEYSGEYSHSLFKLDELGVPRSRLEVWLKSVGSVNRTEEEGPDNQVHEFRIAGTFYKGRSGRPAPRFASKMLERLTGARAEADPGAQSVEAQRWKALCDEVDEEANKEDYVSVFVRGRLEAAERTTNDQRALGLGIVATSDALFSPALKNRGSSSLSWLPAALDYPFHLLRGEPWREGPLLNRSQFVAAVKAELDFDMVSGSNLAERRAVTDDDSFHRAQARIWWETLAFKGVEAQVSWQWNHEFGAPKAIRDAHMATTSYLKASLVIPFHTEHQSIEIRYEGGRLPPTYTRSGQLSLAVSLDF